MPFVDGVLRPLPEPFSAAAQTGLGTWRLVDDGDLYATHYSERTQPDGEGTPVWAILKLLGLSLGVPYMILLHRPLVQTWFARTHAGTSPYRLYALSNVGSLLALVAYPFVVEPWSTRIEQVNGWSWGMALYAVFCGLLVWRMRDVPVVTSSKSKAESETTETRLRRAGLWLCWLALPACGGF